MTKNDLSDGIILDEVFSKELYQELIYYINDCKWKYGWPTSNSVKKYIFNCKHIDVNKFNTDNVENLLDGILLKIWNILKDKIGFISLYNCYSNLMIEGVHAFPHYDSDEDNQVTAVIYICHEWNMFYGGGTSIIRNNEIIKTVSPKPNRVFVFSGNQLHTVQSLTSACVNPRITLMFKGHVANNLIAP